MLTPDQVREVLLRFDLNNTDMAKLLGGCSREAVRQVRQGISHREVFSWWRLQSFWCSDAQAALIAWLRSGE